MTLEQLNTVSAEDARRELLRCCGSARWAAAITGRRPFKSESQLMQAADDAWQALGRTDWLEAFAHHPRIGERSAGWASDEQAGTRSASQKIKDELVKWNGQYERRFGHVFLICATGKQAGDMLMDMERRMKNEPDVELRIAAAEQAKITRLRLEKLLSPSTETSRAR